MPRTVLSATRAAVWTELGQHFSTQQHSFFHSLSIFADYHLVYNKRAIAYNAPKTFMENTALAFKNNFATILKSLSGRGSMFGLCAFLWYQKSRCSLWFLMAAVDVLIYEFFHTVCFVIHQFDSNMALNAMGSVKSSLSFMQPSYHPLIALCFQSHPWACSLPPPTVPCASLEAVLEEECVWGEGGNGGCVCMNRVSWCPKNQSRLVTVAF